jgi:hypothetical protein
LGGRPPHSPAPSFRIEVASSNDELRLALAEACSRAGFRVGPIDDRAVGDSTWSRAPAGSSVERVLTIWDVPVLEPDWPERLERRSLATGPLVAVFGFATRTTVAEAKSRGAVACLELPYHVDDLLDVVDRSARSIPKDNWPLLARAEAPHVLPPRPRSRRVPRPSTEPAPRGGGLDGPPTIV